MKKITLEINDEIVMDDANEICVDLCGEIWYNGKNILVLSINTQLIMLSEAIRPVKGSRALDALFLCLDYVFVPPDK